MSDRRNIEILLIEDDPSVRQMLERALRTGGYGVASIASLYETAVVPPGGFALVISNSHRPFLSGESLAAEIHRAWPGVPILHLHDLTRPLRSALPSEVPSLLKPFSIESLLLAVDHLTAGPGANGQGRAEIG